MPNNPVSPHVESFLLGLLSGKSEMQAIEGSLYKTDGLNRSQKRALILRAKKHPHVQNYLKALDDDLYQFSLANKLNILNELEAIAFIDVLDFFDENGNTLPPHRLPETTARGIVGFKAKYDKNGRLLGYEYKTAKLEALDRLAKIKRMFEEESKNKENLSEAVSKLIDKLPS